MKNAVVIFIMRKNRREILLAQKHKGSEIAGLKWNGYGGKIDPGEKPLKAIIRETDEESDGSIIIKGEDLIYGGVISFYNSDGISDFRVHVFFLDDKFVGLPLSTEVMIDPTWFNFEKLDQVDMMPADKLFLPIILKQGKTIRGRVVFEPGFKGVKEFTYEEISPAEADALLQEVEK